MTVQEWRDRNPDTGCILVFATDAHSFGRKGGSVYGSREVTGRMQIVEIESQHFSFPVPHECPVLHVWDPIVCDPLPAAKEVAV